VHPTLAQTIARHSDVNLTLNVYSHVSIGEQAAAIRSLPAPQVDSRKLRLEADNPQDDSEKLAHGHAQTFVVGWHQPTLGDTGGVAQSANGNGEKPLPQKD
jgi:hypothetical protein